jgi:hypothetical protein
MKYSYLETRSRHVNKPFIIVAITLAYCVAELTTSHVDRSRCRRKRRRAGKRRWQRRYRRRRRSKVRQQRGRWKSGVDVIKLFKAVIYKCS